MKYFYSLRIDCEESNIAIINDILQVESNYHEVGWGLEIIQDGKEDYVDFINNFLDILESKYDSLREIEIPRSRISIWLIYEYQDQCNLEFAPEDLKRLGNNEISLCISCYEG